MLLLQQTMKKVAVILLICVYSLATMGFSLKQFYCCGSLKIVSLSLTGGAKSNPGKNGCCKTTYRFFKINQNHIAADQINSPANHCFLIDFFFISSPEEIFLPGQEFYITNKSHAPPLYNGVPCYLSNCVFRI
jgi:hypothetical protein